MDPESDDWELLHHSEDEHDIVTVSDLDENLTEFGVDYSREGIVIMSDHFSIDSNRDFEGIGIGDAVFRKRNDFHLNDSGFSGEIISGGEKKDLIDSSSDRCLNGEFVDSVEGKELGCVENNECGAEFDETGDVLNKDIENSSRVSFDSGEGRPAIELGQSNRNEVDFGGNKEIPPTVQPVGAESGRNDESSSPLKGENHEISMHCEVGIKNGSIKVTKSRGEIEKRRDAWWKFPMELLKYSLFQGSSVWSVSLGIALMGFLLLGQSLIKMKSKRRTLQLKVTVDDKKVSQFMQSATRLNETFSVVRRVPTIRPMLPAPGTTQWPLMNLR